MYVKEDETGDLSGSMFNESYGFALDFKGVQKMMEILDVLFNYVNFPMATHEERVFHPQKEKKYKIPEGLYAACAEDFKERKPQFRLHVQFRQNSTWQGTLEWISMKKVKQFRSELELIELMTKALD